MGLINAFIKALGSVVTGLLDLLPNTPFSWTLGGLSSYWHYVTVFVPIPEMITMLIAYLSAVSVWYVVRWALRFIKMVG